MKRAAVALGLLATTTVASIAPAQATTSTSNANRSAIVYAAAHNPYTAYVGAKNVSVSSIRLTSTGRWASALVTPRNHMTDPAQVVLHKVNGHWKAVDFGTDAVGCGLLTSRARGQLHLWGGC